ncbi:metallophosphoesterase [Kordiimonas aestuarii]|uniref:metallophosphoesterase n=1 Tax=Kordiimonas aestuarii TaxID=1005925 RepID=UPI0021D15B02|nr:metallophosphoesterase [Kordiimonas aestuarii]
MIKQRYRNAQPNRYYDSGPFDIIGDIHGCAMELLLLLEKLGYKLVSSATEIKKEVQLESPLGRKAIFLGDIVDRGPQIPEALRIVKAMVESGDALCVCGNHEARLMKVLSGQRVKAGYGLRESVAQLGLEGAGFCQEMLSFIRGMPSHYVLDEGRLVVAHAGIPESMHGQTSSAVWHHCLYGGLHNLRKDVRQPVDRSWASEYRGKALVVYGHYAVKHVEWLNGTVCIDTGCVFGGPLTALRYPEMSLVHVSSMQYARTKTSCVSG